ncbi:MAG: hypothetical protein MRY64_03405 [Hyphomonadaceae bacterium]|nr:hypothetical protein [Hyphomonadaceae bacterium]
MTEETQAPLLPSLATQIAVSLVFVLLYAAFLAETGLLVREYSGTGLTLRLASLDAQNFIFFPIAGLLALIGFWRPCVLLSDALARGRIKAGRLVLLFTLIIMGAATWSLSNAFSGGNTRSIYEIAPASVTADAPGPAGENGAIRQSIPDTLTSLKILAIGPDGLSPYKARCDREWLRYSPAAQEQKYCIPGGTELSVADCCEMKTVFREHINDLAYRTPSQLAQVHRAILPVKIFFLVLLFAIGVLLVRYRARLRALYGGKVEDLSFGMAVGGVVMLVWPMLNAAYLETMALLTGDGTSGAYAVMAPLIALGFGIWAMLLVFFHLRTYPSQIAIAARFGGVIGAAIGVLRYEEITGFLISNLGVGGGIVAIVVFAVAVLALIIALFAGISPKDLDFDKET